MNDFDSTTFPTDRLTFITWNDGTPDVTAYLGRVKVGYGEGRADAESDAELTLAGHANGASWATRSDVREALAVAYGRAEYI